MLSDGQNSQSLHPCHNLIHAHEGIISISSYRESYSVFMLSNIDPLHVLKLISTCPHSKYLEVVEGSRRRALLLLLLKVYRSNTELILCSFPF